MAKIWVGTLLPLLSLTRCLQGNLNVLSKMDKDEGEARGDEENGNKINKCKGRGNMKGRSGRRKADVANMVRSMNIHYILIILYGGRHKRAHVPFAVATLSLDAVPVQANLQKLHRFETCG